MRITLLIPDVSSNCSIARYFAMAEVLKRHYQLEIIGPRFGETVWEPYRSSLASLPVETVPSSRLKFGWGNVVRALDERITGDVLYAFKPMMASLGVALHHQKRTGKPIVLDVDDDDLLWPLQDGITGAIRQILVGWLRVDGIYDRVRVHMRRGNISDFLVVSRFLQRRYGGKILHHGCSTDFFDPGKYDRTRIRRELDLSVDDPYVLFTGTALPHKGLEEVIGAARALEGLNLKFLFVGGSPRKDYYNYLLELGRDVLIPFGHRPHETMPKFLAAADYVALPQHDTKHARAQIPAKFYEAMAMGKPVIASAVSDLPELMRGGAGIVVTPGDRKAVEDALRHLIEHPDEAAEMGRKARERAKELFSYDAMEGTLLEVFRKFG